MCIKLTKEALEQFLFSGTDIKIDHVELAHDVDILRIFISGTGYDIAEGQAVAEIHAQKALQHIREEIHKCQTQD